MDAVTIVSQSIMSKINNGFRPRNARETYVEQLPYGRGLTGYMNQKRKPFTHLKSSSDVDFAYRSTPDYLRQINQDNSPVSPEMMIARNIPRTRSASETTPRNNVNRSTVGNPKYKAQEDYYDEIHILKKDMKALKDENSNLRAKLRRAEEDNTRKRKEIDALYDTSKDGDLRRTLAGSSTDRANNNNTPASNVVMNLKQRIFKLELQLKQKESALDELKSDPRMTKATEFEIQNRALFGEIEKQKVERSHYLQNDYTAAINEEAKNAVRKLNTEKDELKKENESLKKKIQDLNKEEHGQELSARSANNNNDKLEKEIEKLRRECKGYKNEIERLTNDLEETNRKRDPFREKFNQANDELNEVKRERNQLREKLDQANEDLQEAKRDRDQYRKKFEQANENLESKLRDNDRHTKLNQSGRSSPAFRRDEDSLKESPNLSTTRVTRPQSPTIEKPTPRAAHSSVTSLQKNKPSEIQSPRASFKGDNLGSDIKKNRPASPNIANESALKTVQASLRGHLSRTELDKSRDQTSSSPIRSRTPTRVDTDDEDSMMTPSKRRGSFHENDKQRDSIHDSPKTNSKQTSFNDKMGSNNQIPSSSRDSVSKAHQSHSPSDDVQRPSSPYTGKVGGSKEALLSERNKFGSGNQIQPNDRKSAAKLDRSLSPPDESYRSSSSRTSKTGGSKDALTNERTKVGSGNRMQPSDRDSATKPHHTPSPTDDSRRSPSPHLNKSAGSKEVLPNERNKLGSGNRMQPFDRESATKPHHTPSPTDDSRRSTSPLASKSSDSKQRLPNEQNKPGSSRAPISDRDSATKIRQDTSQRPSLSDRSKLGSGARLPTNDHKPASKSRSPSPPPNRQPSRPETPENSQPPSRKNSMNAKQSAKDTRNKSMDHDDDDDVAF